MAPGGIQEGLSRTGPRRGGRSARTRVDPEALRRLGGRITAMEEQKDPQRRSLFIDGRFALGLDLETIHTCGFRVGQEVDGDALLRACGIDQAKRAWDSALGLLAASPRSVKELELRLARTYPPELVGSIITRLLDGGWLDDAAFAASYIRSRPEFGARRLLTDLARKGVDRAVAARAVQEVLGEADLVGQASGVAARRLARMGQVDRLTAQRRLIGYLSRRGFSPDVIRQAVSPLLDDLPLQEKPPRGRSADPSVRAVRLGEGSTLSRTGGLKRRKPLRPQAEEEPET